LGFRGTPQKLWEKANKVYWKKLWAESFLSLGEYLKGTTPSG